MTKILNAQIFTNKYNSCQIEQLLLKKKKEIICVSLNNYVYCCMIDILRHIAVGSLNKQNFLLIITNSSKSKSSWCVQSCLRSIILIVAVIQEILKFCLANVNQDLSVGKHVENLEILIDLV